MKAHGLTDNGIIRSQNQDTFVIRQDRTGKYLVVAVCDGMGGEKAGEVASQTSAHGFADLCVSKLKSNGQNYNSILIDACNSVNQYVYGLSQANYDYFGMGTTLVGGIIDNDGVCNLLNVGDSRAYLISRKQKKISQITKDHSYVQLLVDRGIITPHQAKHHKDKNVITMAVGTEEYINPDCYKFKLMTGDVLLLCSDGIHNIIEDNEMFDIVLSHKHGMDICQALINLALYRGAPDNITALAVYR